MKMLSIGFPMPALETENYNVLTAPSYFDYDAIYVDPVNISDTCKKLLEGEEALTTHDRVPVLNGATSALGVSAAEQLKRRSDETHRLLEAGGLVLVAGRPNVTIPGIVGFEGADRFSWLPAPAGVDWGPPFLRAGEGKNIRVIADDHPLGDFMRDFRKDLVYRAVLDERRPELRRSGRVIATGGANVPIAMEFEVLNGKVIFLPAFKEVPGPERIKIANAIVDAVSRLLGTHLEDRPPAWTRTLALPGLEQLEAEVADAEAAAKEASARLATAKARESEINSYRRLLWQEGRPFEDAVADALALIGFTRKSEKGDPLEVESEGRVAFVEAASTREQIVEWPYVHLQRRLEQRLLETKEQNAGIIVVNGKRGEAPEARKEPFTEALRIACENYRYALVPAETLFAMVQRAMGGADEATLAGMRRRLLAANGVLERDVALGDVEEGRDAGPIF